MKSSNKPITPGPWRVDGEGYFAVVESFEGIPICEIEMSPENEANASLIAAAPDLLAALEALLECDTDDAGNGYEELTAPATYFSRARAAIKRAREQQPPRPHTTRER